MLALLFQNKVLLFHLLLSQTDQQEVDLMFASTHVYVL